MRRLVTVFLAAVVCGIVGCSTPDTDGVEPPPPPSPRVVSLSATLSDDTVAVGGRVTALAEEVTDKGIVLHPTGVWTISDSTVASVAPDGSVLAHRPGTVVVTATVDTLRASVALTVVPAPAARVVIVGTAPISPIDQLAGEGARGGDVFRESAIVLDIYGDTLRSAPVLWSSADTTLASVAADGTVRIRAGAFGERSVDIAVASGAASATVTIYGSDWSIDTSVDRVTLDTTVSANLATYGIGSYPSGRLSLTCSGGFFIASVSSGANITANGVISYRFSGIAPVTTTWTESPPSYTSLYVANEAARTFASNTLRADTLFVQYGFFGGGGANLVFLLRNAGSVYPAVGARCQ